MGLRILAKDRPIGACFCGRPSAPGIISCESCRDSSRRSHERARRAGHTNVWSLDRRCRSYGITVEQYDEMLAAQGGLCKICRQPETLIRKGTLCKLTIDHNHETGEVRGILCNNCNRALGMLKDDPATLRLAAEYLEAS